MEKTAFAYFDLAGRSMAHARYARHGLEKEAMGPLLSGGRAVMSRLAPVAGKAIGKVAPGVGNKVSKWGKSLLGNNMTSKGNSIGAIAKETINPLNWA